MPIRCPPERFRAPTWSGTPRACRTLGPLTALALVVASGACTDPIVDRREPGSTIPAAATTWLRHTVLPFDGTAPSASHADLAFLTDLVGDARIVGLGENTHGTRDFFEMKARILRYLVEEMGFTAFAIEASWPEANRLDHWVRTGEGSDGRLLAGLYFWTWRTRTVLDMIRWMRGYSEAGGKLGFYGFDMQYPGMAIHNVTSYVATVRSGSASEFESRMACMAEVANDAFGRFAGQYAGLPHATRDACRADLLWVRNELSARRDEYIASAPVEDFERALQSARVVLQYEGMKSGIRPRDASMAENVAWLLDQLGPDARIVLWAHNYHVGYRPGAMGDELRTIFGEDYVSVAFSHASGVFTAESEQGRGPFELDPLRERSFEAYFHSTGIPRFILDLRPEPPASDSAAWLKGPLSYRVVGCCIREPGTVYWTTGSLRDDHDIVIHVDRTRATEVLELTPPGVW